MMLKIKICNTGLKKKLRHRYTVLNRNSKNYEVKNNLILQVLNIIIKILFNISQNLT